MSDNKDEREHIILKGVIPAKRTTPEEVNKAIRNLRDFLQKFPFLAEEVMKEREKWLNEDGRNINNRNQLRS